MNRAMSHARKPRPPLERAQLADLALHYAGRYMTTAKKLETYLRRKLRERGWAGEGEPPVAEIVAKCVEQRFVDDEAYASTKADALLRRGYGARRIAQALHHAGVPETIREDQAPSELDRRMAALALARRRRFGPFARPNSVGAVDQALRDKQLAAMMRAGHAPHHARALVDAKDEREAEEWVTDCHD